MGLHNLQDTVGLRLERIARDFLREESLLLVGNSFYAAARISAGSFVEVMFYLLRIKFGLDESFEEFAKECQPLFGKPLTKSDEELALLLLTKFEIMMK